jgi:hypothetical protein
MTHNNGEFKQRPWDKDIIAVGTLIIVFCTLFGILATPKESADVATSRLSAFSHAIWDCFIQFRWPIFAISFLSLVWIFRANIRRSYIRALRSLLAPVLPPPVVATPTPLPFDIKLGELEFTLPKGTPYRGGEFAFDKPFPSEPHVYIAESTGGNWLLVKIDAKSRHGFRWAAQRATAQEGDYSVHLQWIAISPNIDENVGASAKLVIHSATYGFDGITANLTRVLRTKIKNDSLTEICGNHLGGDPYVGHGKILLINYRYDGQEKILKVDETVSFKLPS